MKIAVYGMTHLGCTTAAAMSSQYEVIAVDDSPDLIQQLRSGLLPVYEPGLTELARENATASRLHFSHNLSDCLKCDVIWFALDVPVNEVDEADEAFITQKIEALFPFLKRNAVFLISSQVPVGTTRALAQRYRAQFPETPVFFCYSPENLRLGRSLDAFLQPERIVLGADPEFPQQILISLLSWLTPNLLWMSIESAEMSKHALNSFLALSITFINEVASLCRSTGASPTEVEKALRSEPRVGAKALIRPGPAFGGGTLARDIRYLLRESERQHTQTPLLRSILESNYNHQSWPIRALETLLGSLQSKKVTLLGLAYKPGTSSTRRSIALFLAGELLKRGASVTAFDPKVRALPPPFSGISIAPDCARALKGADAAIVTTEWADFLSLTPTLFQTMKHQNLVDPTRFLQKVAERSESLNYVSLC